MVAELLEPRTSRSVALLLPDGRVWVAGGVDPDGTERHRTTMSFYEPPYYTLPRPVIAADSNEVGTDAAVTLVSAGQEFVVRTPQAATIQRAALLRPGSVTHHTDTQQRYVDLPITSRQDDRIHGRDSGRQLSLAAGLLHGLDRRRAGRAVPTSVLAATAAADRQLHRG